jgi:DNA-binding LytR/AlgR family response regulator
LSVRDLAMENMNPYGKIESSKEKLAFILLFGLFIFLFLFLFKPFGIGQLAILTQFLLCLGFGFITTFVLIIFKYLIEPAVIKSRLSLLKSILWNILIASTIGVANYFFVSVVLYHVFVFEYFLISIWTAILVGIIPVTITYFVSHNRRYREALRQAAISPDEILWESEVTIKAGNPKNDFRVNPKTIIYLCSNDNYVTVVSAKGETVSKTHLRGTLKAAESELGKNKSFIRCHKCYIVNSEYVDNLTGNLQNLKIRLKIPGLELPVSRSNAPEIVRKFRMERSVHLSR